MDVDGLQINIIYLRECYTNNIAALSLYREEESRKLVKSLQKQLIEVNKEKESEIQVCYI